MKDSLRAAMPHPHSSHVARLIQLSDLHLFSDAERCLNGENTRQRFTEVLQRAKRYHRDDIPTVTVLSGDLAEDEQAKTYQHLATMLADYPQPVLWIPGNHDNLQSMTSLLTSSPLIEDKQILIGNWNIIGLNSKQPKEKWGYLADTSLAMLRSQLQQHDNPTLLVLHHHVRPIDHDIDAIALKNADAFLSLLSEFPQVKCVLSGHVHQARAEQYHGIGFYTCPATAYQIDPTVKKFKLDPQSAGFRLVDLWSCGNYRTEVIRCDNQKPL